METETIIDFDGKKVTNKTGFFKCPYHCGDHRYPAKKWKTISGFEKHMTECSNRPSLIKQKELKQVETDRKISEIKERTLVSLSYKIGDDIIFIRERITKPTHIQRGSRLVKVRYEPKKEFTAEKTTINTINWIDNVTEFFGEEGMIKNNVIFNGSIPLWWIVNTSFEEAKILARKKQSDYDEYLRFSSEVR